ncbi:MAG: CopG family transcriptional regulator [Kineosporiaceae bacterium]
MEKTTVYLPQQLKRRLRQVARARGVSEAEVIRQALEAEVGEAAPRPRSGVFAGGEPIAERVDELLAGFGER